MGVGPDVVAHGGVPVAQLGDGEVAFDDVDPCVRAGPELLFDGVTGVGLLVRVVLVVGEVDVEDIALGVLGEEEAAELGDSVADFSE